MSDGFDFMQGNPSQGAQANELGKKGILRQNILSKESKITLRNGSKLPVLGFGTYLCSADEARASVASALALGYRHIDTAEFYANHEGIAAGIAEAAIPRSEIFITDKLMPGALGMPEKTYDDTVASLKEHLQKLNTNYVDLYLLHHAFAKNERINQWRALVDLQKEGLIREVGVSNWDIRHIEEIKAAGLPLPAANQLELHPLCSRPELIAYLNEQGIVPIAYSSLAPLSTWRVFEDSDHWGGQAAAGTLAPRSEENVSKVLNDIASKHGVTQAQVLLRWALTLNFAILPKSTKPERMAQNADVFDFSLSPEDMAALNGLNKNTAFAWEPNGDPLDAE